MIEARAQGAAATSGFKYYFYDPSLAAAIIFIILFGISAVLHCFQMIRSRAWFMLPFCIGAIFESVGYIGRALSAEQAPGPYTLGPYILQSVLLLVAPAFFAASIYMELGRIVAAIERNNALASPLLWIRRTWLTRIFVSGDVLSFLMQASGAGLLASKSISTINTGSNVVVGGLIVQVLFFGVFIATSAIFHVRTKRLGLEVLASSSSKSGRSKHSRLYVEFSWRKHLIAMYCVSALIFVRSIVRVVEFAQGFTGFITKHEVFLYIFDAMVMILASAIMNWIHPAEIGELLKREGWDPKGKQQTRSESYRMMESQDV